MTEDIEPHYRGEVLNCIRNGKGSYKYEIGGNGLFIYDGQWSQGHKKGSGGKFTMKGIHQVTGDFSDGEITGHGIKTWSDGRRYEGGWLNGEMDGKGDWISSDGDEMYSGSFKDNKREGFGVLVFNRPSSIHRGCFSLNRKNGFGTYLCPNSVYIEGNFVDNLIQGTVKVNWQKMANLVGHCSDGLFDGSCYYCTADGCYQFDGLFAKGFPVPSLEATYVYLDIDRSDVVMKVSEDVVPVTITPRKKTPTTVKKSKVVDIVDIQLLQVQVGFELGKVIIRAGTQIDIDDRKRRAEMLAEAALLVSSAATSKTSKAAKISTTVAQDLDMIDANYPSPSGGKHTLPEELQRNVIVRIRSVISGEPDLESAFAGTSTLSSTSKSANKMAAAITERILSPDSYGPPIMFWLRKPSLDKFSDCYERFPLTSFTYIGGVKRTPVDFTSEEGDVRVKVESRETFTAATSAHLITVSKNPSKGDMILTSHELISPSKYLPSLEDSSSNALIIEPSVTFTVPYTEIRGAANSVSFIIDFTLNEKLLLDSYMALTLNDRHGSTVFTESNIRSSDFVLVPVLNVMKDGIDVDNHSPKISSIEHGISEVLQLVLMIPSKHFVQAALYKRAAEELACQQKEIVRLASEALEITKLQRQASLSDAAINVAAAATTIGSPKPRKSTPTKKKSLPKVEKDKEASTASKSAVGSPNIPEKMELNETTTADNVPAVEWTDCFWQLSVITTTNEIISPKSLSTAALRDDVGLRDPLFANSVSTGSITRGVDESSSSKTHVQPVQRWGCGTFNSSAWHSLALTARLSAEEKSSIDMVNGTGDGEMGEKHSASKEQRVLMTSPSLELVLDGHGLLPAKLNGESTVASSVAHTSSWLMSDNVHINDVPKALCPGDNRSSAASLEIDCESADLKSARGQVTDETSLKSLISYKLVAGCQEVHSFSDSMYGLTFQGAVRALSICGSGDRPDLLKITSCYADWRSQEDEWPALKKREMGGVSNGQNLSRNDLFNDNESDSCEVEMALRAMNVTPAAPVPSDCTSVRELHVSLKSGYGDFDNILLPSDTPPGKYVIEVSDGVSSNCLRYQTSDFIPTDLVGFFPSPSQALTGHVSSRNKATLEEMKGLFPVVRPIRVNRQILFHAVSVSQPVT